MTRDKLLSYMFSGPAPSVKREQGIRDARAGKPALSLDRDYRAGYELGRDLALRGESDKAVRRSL